MSPGEGGKEETGVHPGLCAACHHAAPVTSARGSSFILCGRSRTDPRYPRYPGLPVLRCPGFEELPRPAGGADPA